MKLLQGLLLCLWIQSTSSVSVSPMCACASKPTLLTSSVRKPRSIAWPGTCFKIAESNSLGSSWSRLVAGDEKLFGLTESFQMKICPNHLNSRLGHCPNIISRHEWHARAPRNTAHLSTPVKYAVVHHSETPQCLTKTSCIKRIQSIQNYHMDVKEFDDIGYNFLVGGDGNVYEGRGWDTMGAHTKGFNSISIGICVVGNYMKATPNRASLISLKDMLNCLEGKRKLGKNYLLRGHRDLGNTDCPGNTLYNIIKRWPHYNV